MTLKLCVIPGDGVGAEVIPSAVEVLRAVAQDLAIIYLYRRQQQQTGPASLSLLQ